MRLIHALFLKIKLMCSPLSLSVFFFFLDNCNGLGATSFFIFIIGHFIFYFQLHSVMIPTFSISINLLDLLVKSELNFCFYMWDLLIDQHPCILYNCPLLILHMGPSDFFFIYRWVKKSWRKKPIKLQWSNRESSRVIWGVKLNRINNRLRGWIELLIVGFYLFF